MLHPLMCFSVVVVLLWSSGGGHLLVRCRQRFSEKKGNLAQYIIISVRPATYPSSSKTCRTIHLLLCIASHAFFFGDSSRFLFCKHSTEHIEPLIAVHWVRDNVRQADLLFWQILRRQVRIQVCSTLVMFFTRNGKPLVRSVK